MPYQSFLNHQWLANHSAINNDIPIIHKQTMPYQSFICQRWHTNHSAIGNDQRHSNHLPRSDKREWAASPIDLPVAVSGVCHVISYMNDSLITLITGTREHSSLPALQLTPWTTDIRAWERGDKRQQQTPLVSSSLLFHLFAGFLAIFRCKCI